MMTGQYVGCKVKPCHARDDQGKRWCLPGVRRVLVRYNLSPNEFFSGGIDVAVMENIDNPLMRKAVDNAKSEWDRLHGR